MAASRTALQQLAKKCTAQQGNDQSTPACKGLSHNATEPTQSSCLMLPGMVHQHTCITQGSCACRSADTDPMLATLLSLPLWVSNQLDDLVQHPAALIFGGQQSCLTCGAYSLCHKLQQTMPYLPMLMSPESIQFFHHCIWPLHLYNSTISTVSCANTVLTLLFLRRFVTTVNLVRSYSLVR